MPKLGLEKDDQHHAGADRRRMKNPDGDHKIELSCDQRAHLQPQDADGHAQCTRIAAPTQQEIDGRRQDDEVHDALPAEPIGCHAHPWRASGAAGARCARSSCESRTRVATESE